MQNYIIKNSIDTDKKINDFGIKSLTEIEILNLIINKQLSKNEYLILNKFIFDKKCDKNIIESKFDIKITDKILAIKELIRRYNNSYINKITSPSEIYNELKYIRLSKQENFILLTLDGSGCLIKKRILFKGTLNKSLVHPREIFYYVLKDRSASFIIAHNHPSGNTQPSDEDIEITKRIYKLSEFFGINLLDHIIFSSSNYYSFAIENLII